MQFTRLRNAVLAASLLAVAGFVTNTVGPLAHGQSAVTGAVSGTVSDATGAVLPGATVTVIDTATDSKQVVKTNAEGRYTVGLLKPGQYKITAAAESLKSDTLEVSVILGTTIPADIKVTPTGSNTVVEVTSTSLPLVDTQNIALATTFSEEQIQDLPTPGGDVTTIAFTAPGVVVNAGGSYGNFSSDGLPGISNLFVLNGFDNQDPFLNLNNSGSSNLTLGQGELADATVIQNAYNSQYGRAAGAIIQYTTKSGSNRFHGEADYNWNGSALNANGWFNEHDEVENGQPNVVPHAVSNEWAVNAGGPIIKDKVFFFADWEGLRYVLPASSGLLTFPSPQLATYSVNNAPAASQGLMGQAMADFAKGAAYKTAIPVANGAAGNQDANNNLGCGAAAAGGLAGTPAPGGGTFGVDTPCMLVSSAAVNNVNKEWLFTGRADWNVTDKHKIYGRYKMDRGSQPTSTSSIDPLFSAVSIQPEYEGQFNDSYVISPTKTNVFVAAANWYTAYFGPANVAASQALYPWYGITDAGFDGSGTPDSPGLASLGVPYYFPQGRNVTQYQIEDDFSWIKGKNTMKYGFNFRRDLVEDYDAQVLTQFPLLEVFDLGTFSSGAEGVGGVDGIYLQNFSSQSDAHLALYNIGIYFQDELQATPKLKLTLGVRLDRTGNPLCHGGCFSLYKGAFPNANASVNYQYNWEVQSENWHPFDKVQFGNIQPRFGFNYSVDDKTEVRGGVGLFADLYPAGFLDGVIQNFPNVNSLELLSGTISSTDPAGLTANAAAGNAAFTQGYKNGQNVSQIFTNLNNQGIPFTPPSIGAYFPGTFKTPIYTEYSLQIQRQLNRSSAVILTYAGNFGFDGVLINPDLNPSNGEYGLGPSLANPWGPVGSIGGLGSTPPDPSFSKVTAYTNNGHSNYNGLMMSYKHSGHGLTGQVSYTYSHSLDMVSNGGEGEYFNGGSVTTQLTPTIGAGNLNYSNSDYDIRNNLVGDVVYQEPFKSGSRILNEFAAGWTIGAKTYYRGGEPFTISDANAANSGYTNLGSEFMVQNNVSRSALTNTSASNPHSATMNPALDATQYSDPSATNFGTLRRNSLYGPHYADTDLSVVKKVVTAEGFTFSIGANAYNAFNNVNFSAPGATLGTGNFGLITGTNAPPTSPYGSFQGAAVTQRVLQVHGKITF